MLTPYSLYFYLGFGLNQVTRKISGSLAAMPHYVHLPDANFVSLPFSGGKVTGYMHYPQFPFGWHKKVIQTWHNSNVSYITFLQRGVLYLFNLIDSVS